MGFGDVNEVIAGYIATALSGRRIVIDGTGTVEDPTTIAYLNGSGLSIGMLQASVVDVTSHLTLRGPADSIAVNPNGPATVDLTQNGIDGKTAIAVAADAVTLTAAGGVVTVSGALAEAGEVWQTPAYAANWADSTTFNGLTGYDPLRFRRNADDTVTIIGTVKATGVTGNTVFQLPASCRPVTASKPIFAQRNNAGALTTGHCYVSTSGNVNLYATAGVAVGVAGNEYVISGTFPLRNLT